jgi:hypothetical protein
LAAYGQCLGCPLSVNIVNIVYQKEIKMKKRHELQLYCSELLLNDIISNIMILDRTALMFVYSRDLTMFSERIFFNMCDTLENKFYKDVKRLEKLGKIRGKDFV